MTLPEIGIVAVCAALGYGIVRNVMGPSKPRPGPDSPRDAATDADDGDPA